MSENYQGNNSKTGDVSYAFDPMNRLGVPIPIEEFSTAIEDREVTAMQIVNLMGKMDEAMRKDFVAFLNCVKLLMEGGSRMAEATSNDAMNATGKMLLHETQRASISDDKDSA